MTPTHPYVVVCRSPRRPDGRWTFLSEWHTSLASALDALLDHQQRHWASVTLTPYVAPVGAPRQMPLVFGGRL
jgi:hypothetical protein